MFELQECLLCEDNLADSNCESDFPICSVCFANNNQGKQKQNSSNNPNEGALVFYGFSKHPEIDEIIPEKLYLGNEDASSMKEELKKRNITHVLAVGCGLKKHFENEFTYMHINIDDTMYQNIAKHFQSTFDFIESGERVFVHCAAGVSRSSTIVIAYIMKKQNKTYDEAFSQVKNIRYVIRPNVGFIRQLREYEKTLKE